MIFAIIIIALLFLMVFCLLLLVIFFMIIYTRVPFVKTPRAVIDLILREVKITAADTVYDLGCGDAQFLIAVEKLTRATTVGYELSPWAYALAKINIKINKSRAKVYYKNFYKQDLSPANFIFCFLIPSVMPKVGTQLKKQLKPGATIVSFAFKIPDWPPAKVIDIKPNNPKASKIYIYNI